MWISMRHRNFVLASCAVLSFAMIACSAGHDGSSQADTSGTEQRGDAGAIPSFDTPTWISPQEFQSIAGVRELADGRVLVTDVAAPMIHLLDARGQPIRTIGRKGRGPAEYLRPQSLAPFRSDSTF